MISERRISHDLTYILGRRSGINQAGHDWDVYDIKDWIFRCPDGVLDLVWGTLGMTIWYYEILFTLRIPASSSTFRCFSIYYKFHTIEE